MGAHADGAASLIFFFLEHNRVACEINAHSAVDIFGMIHFYILAIQPHQPDQSERKEMQDGSLVS